MIFKTHMIVNFVVLIMLLTWHGTATAEIYKYQDEFGRWHFSDQPPDSSKGKYAVTYQSRRSGSGDISDYQKSLKEKYKPKNPVETATLAVVTVKTNIGTGSGFFVSDDCYLITNKHVVRPTTTKSWKSSEEDLKNEKSSIKEAKRYISEEKERLDIEKRRLGQQRAYIDGLRAGGYKNNEEVDYQFNLRAYNKDVEKLEETIQKTRNQEREYQKRHSDFSIDSSIANVTKSFKIVLKDNTSIQAKLVQIADDEDLALLKVDGCKSPYLIMEQTIQPFQGMNIYAVGSPLGLKDHVTAGVVTNIRTDGINTDAQILPGNSGGPLITQKGEVIGVNTLKVSADNPNSEGFGVAIPVNRVLQEFGRYIEQKPGTPATETEVSKQ